MPGYSITDATVYNGFLIKSLQTGQYSLPKLLDIAKVESKAGDKKQDPRRDLGPKRDDKVKDPPKGPSTSMAGTTIDSVK